MSQSSRYQHLYNEIIGLDQAVMNNYANDQSIASVLNTDPVIQEYREQLLYEVLKLVTDLTKHQQKVLRMTFDGYTQVEIAKQLGVCQSAIHKAIHGNIDYTNNGKVYGGAVTKLRKLAEKSPRIVAILECMDLYRKTGIQQPVVDKQLQQVVFSPRKQKSVYLIDANGRQCRKCELYQPWECYTKDNSQPSGKSNLCRECSKHQYHTITKLKPKKTIKKSI